MRRRAGATAARRAPPSTSAASAAAPRDCRDAAARRIVESSCEKRAVSADTGAHSLPPIFQLDLHPHPHLGPSDSESLGHMLAALAPMARAPSPPSGAVPRLLGLHLLPTASGAALAFSKRRRSHRSSFARRGSIHGPASLGLRAPTPISCITAPRVPSDAASLDGVAPVGARPIGGAPSRISIARAQRYSRCRSEAVASTEGPTSRLRLVGTAASQSSTSRSGCSMRRAWAPACKRPALGDATADSGSDGPRGGGRAEERAFSKQRIRGVRRRRRPSSSRGTSCISRTSEGRRQRREHSAAWSDAEREGECVRHGAREQRQHLERRIGGRASLSGTSRSRRPARGCGTMAMRSRLRARRELGLRLGQRPIGVDGGGGVWTPLAAPQATALCTAAAAAAASEGNPAERMARACGAGVRASSAVRRGAQQVLRTSTAHASGGGGGSSSSVADESAGHGRHRRGCFQVSERRPPQERTAIVEELWARRMQPSAQT